jgi:hypothetical protein
MAELTSIFYRKLSKIEILASQNGRLVFIKYLYPNPYLCNQNFEGRKSYEISGYVPISQLFGGK